MQTFPFLFRSTTRGNQTATARSEEYDMHMNEPGYQEKTDAEIIELAKSNADFFGVLMERYESPLLR